MCALCVLAGKPLGGFGCLDASAAPSPDIADGDPAVGAAMPGNVVESGDASASAATAYNLAAAQVAQGQIASNSDADWYRIDLVAGHTYTFAVTGEGALNYNLYDPYLYLRNSAGAEITHDDDGGPGTYSNITWTAAATGTYYLDVQSWNNASTGHYRLSVTEASRASYDIDMGAAAILVPGRSWAAPTTGTAGTGTTVTWGFRQSAPSYNTSSNTQGTFSQLSAAQMAAAQTIMQLWADISGVQFTQVNPGGTTNSATILFANYNSTTDGAGAFAYYPVYGQTDGAAQPGDVYLNTNSVSTSLLPFGSYSFFAIMHEVGHTLGLSHPGDYNAAPGQTITYASNAQFTQDSQQYTVMSYFDEANTGAQFNGYADTPQLLDVYALQQLYGANMSTRTGDTVYGFGTDAGAVYDFATNTKPAFTIWDAGGTDTLNASGFGQDQSINLNAGTFSSIGALSRNIAIAIGAVIENATGGSGSDAITGNAANNLLRGNGGNDTMDAGGGFDAAVYSGLRSSYALTHNSNGAITVTDSRGGSPDGTDSLTNVEALKFSNLTISTMPLSDFGGDFTGDVLLRSTSSGALTVWKLSNGGFVSSTVLGNVASNIQVVGTGDFNHDGTSDVLLRDLNAGSVSDWRISNDGSASSRELGRIGSNIQIGGVGDFNGDNNSDVLLRDTITGAVSIWTIDVNNAYAASTVIGYVGGSIQMGGVGDFNSNGSSDILLRDLSTGAVTYWGIANNAFTGSHQLGGVGSNIQVVGAYDFTGDNNADILLRDMTTGAVTYWAVNSSGAFVNSIQLGGVGSNIDVIGARDINGDGYNDVLLRDNASGTVGAFTTFNGQFAQYQGIGIASSDWRVT